VAPGTVRHLAVVADDLTGAADAAAPFAARGLKVSVVLPSSDVLPADAEVLALLTDNRWRPEAEAARRMRAAVLRIRDWGPEMLFVKIDSTLRGRVRADVAVALDAWGGGGAVATPAFPGQGRTVQGGALAVHGETTVERVEDHFPPGVRVADAETDDDLAEIARRIVADGSVAVGSGGLSRALAALREAPPRHRQARAGATGVLLVVGTPHAATKAQVTHVLGCGAELVVVGATGPSPAGPVIDPAVATVAAALRAGRRIVLTCEVTGDVEPDSPQAVALAAKLAQVVTAVLDAAPYAGLVLTGGATALAVAIALGADEVCLLSEVTPGLPQGEMVVGDRRIPVVTKSGGFGAQDALCRAAEALEVRP
jgi:uncharacterized protein YgbK (DUF1537 family)